MLSIVIPCFQRHDLIRSCLKSIDCDRNKVEIVVVDDGSTPPLAVHISDLLESQDKLIVQQNRGRGAALRAGILVASGEHTLLMDSDDEFVPHMLDSLLDELRDQLGPSSVGLVYETVGFDRGDAISRLPHKVDATLLSLRADWGVRGDLKEIIRTSVLKAALYADPGSERRVPTSFIWSGVSECGSVRTIARALVRHRYLENGMTKSIRALKRENPYWLSRTYLRIATARQGTYKSVAYRFRAAVKVMSVADARLVPAEIESLKRSVGQVRYWTAKGLGAMVRIWQAV